MEKIAVYTGKVP